VGDRYLCPDCKISYDLDFNPMDIPFAWEEDGKVKLLELKPCPKCKRELMLAWAYLKAIVDAWKLRRKVLITKSRQMLLTWMMVCLHTWEDVVRPNSLTMCQSKTEDKAKEIIKRLGDVHTHFPDFIRENESYGKLLRPPSQLEYWYTNGSRIKAVPKGPEQATGFTCTSFFSDEMAYQDEAEKAHAEVSPTLGGKGRFTGVSTMNGKGFFWRLVYDKKEGDV
jgi:hypothetical protein